MADELTMVVLAAGKGTRMKSRTPKLLHPVCGTAILTWVLRAARALDPAQIIVVVDERDGAVSQLATSFGAELAVQSEPLGTGHALLQAKDLVRSDRLLVVPGDLSLLEGSVLLPLVDAGATSGAEPPDLTVVTMRPRSPGSYGRIVRDADGKIHHIVESRDATLRERTIDEVNSGVYVLRNEALLWRELESLAVDNVQREYYITDLVAAYRQRGRSVAAVVAADATAFLGINSRADLARACDHMYRRTADRWMEAGVTIPSPATTFIEPDVILEPDTTILPGTHLLGATTIGAACVIGPDVWAADTRVEKDCEVRYSVVEQATIRSGSRIGPYAHLRPGADVGPNVRIGNFVEVKASRVGDGAKVGHLTYLGDADVGQHVNIGAGTITCNYDGKSKHRTIIEDEAFIGSNASLIAPVTIGKGSLVAGGSTITEDVPEGARAFGRARQVIKPQKPDPGEEETA